MEKIKALLEQLGGSKELATTIVKTLEEWKNKSATEIKEEYQKRLEKAKALCLEEVESYKRDLARKVQIFFETRSEKIEQQIAKQVAIKDAAAEAKLQSIAALLEGVEVNGKGDTAEVKAAQGQVQQLTEQLHAEQENSKMLAEKAIRAHSIAGKTLERNKVLAKELQEALVKAGKPINETKVEPAKPVAEGKTEGKPEAKKEEPAKSLTEGRKPSAEPATTRLSDHSQVATKVEPKKEAPVIADSFSPDAIAASLEE